MGFTFFQDENGKDFFPVGLQAHNSSTGTELIGKAIQAVKAYGGNCLKRRYTGTAWSRRRMSTRWSW